MLGWSSVFTVCLLIKFDTWSGASALDLHSVLMDLDFCDTREIEGRSDEWESAPRAG